MTPALPGPEPRDRHRGLPGAQAVPQLPQRSPPSTGTASPDPCCASTGPPSPPRRKPLARSQGATNAVPAFGLQFGSKHSPELCSHPIAAVRRHWDPLGCKAQRDTGSGEGTEWWQQEQGSRRECWGWDQNQDTGIRIKETRTVGESWSRTGRRKWIRAMEAGAEGEGAGQWEEQGQGTRIRGPGSGLWESEVPPRLHRATLRHMHLPQGL